MCLHNIVSHLLTIDFPSFKQLDFLDIFDFKKNKKEKFGFAKQSKKGAPHKSTNYEPNFVLRSLAFKKKKETPALTDYS